MNYWGSWFFFVFFMLKLKYFYLLAGNLGKPILLSVWFPVPGLHHLSNFGVTDLDCHGLFPALWGGEFFFFFKTFYSISFKIHKTKRNTNLNKITLCCFYKFSQDKYLSNRNVIVLFLVHN